MPSFTREFLKSLLQRGLGCHTQEKKKKSTRTESLKAAGNVFVSGKRNARVCGRPGGTAFEHQEAPTGGGRENPEGLLERRRRRTGQRGDEGRARVSAAKLPPRRGLGLRGPGFLLPGVQSLCGFAQPGAPGSSGRTRIRSPVPGLWRSWSTEAGQTRRAC